MNIAAMLNSIRCASDVRLSFKDKVQRVFYIFVFGIISGALAKYLDTVALDESLWSYFLNILGDMFTLVGVWIFIGTLIAVYSRSPRAAYVHVFSYCFGMLVSYYLYSKSLFGFFPTRYFLLWSVVGVAGSLFAYVIWFGRGNGLVSRMIAAIPIGVLLMSGVRGLMTFDLFFVNGMMQTWRCSQLVDLIFAFVLSFILFRRL